MVLKNADSGITSIKDRLIEEIAERHTRYHAKETRPSLEAALHVFWNRMQEAASTLDDIEPTTVASLVNASITDIDQTARAFSDQENHIAPKCHLAELAIHAIAEKVQAANQRHYVLVSRVIPLLEGTLLMHECSWNRLFGDKLSYIVDDLTEQFKANPDGEAGAVLSHFIADLARETAKLFPGNAVESAKVYADYLQELAKSHADAKRPALVEPEMESVSKIFDAEDLKGLRDEGLTLRGAYEVAIIGLSVWGRADHARQYPNGVERHIGTTAATIYNWLRPTVTTSNVPGSRCQLPLAMCAVAAPTSQSARVS